MITTNLSITMCLLKIFYNHYKLTKIDLWLKLKHRLAKSDLVTK